MLASRQWVAERSVRFANHSERRHARLDRLCSLLPKSKYLSYQVPGQKGRCILTSRSWQEASQANDNLDLLHGNRTCANIDRTPTLIQLHSMIMYSLRSSPKSIRYPCQYPLVSSDPNSPLASVVLLLYFFCKSWKRVSVPTWRQDFCLHRRDQCQVSCNVPTAQLNLSHRENVYRVGHTPFERPSPEALIGISILCPTN